MCELGQHISECTSDHTQEAARDNQVKPPSFTFECLKWWNPRTFWNSYLGEICVTTICNGAPFLSELEQHSFGMHGGRPHLSGGEGEPSRVANKELLLLLIEKNNLLQILERIPAAFQVVHDLNKPITYFEGAGSRNTA